MEQMHHYRYVIDKETKEIFIKSMKEAIQKADLSKIGFIGIIGSLEKQYSHDIDVLIFPSKKAKIGETVISITKFYEKLEKILKSYHERFYPVIASKKSMQEMIYYIAGLQEGNAGLIPLHSLFFPDYKSFKKLNPKDFQKEIKKSLVTLYGEFEIINKIKNDIPQKKLESYFLILDFEITSKIKTFPRHLVRTSAESLFSYLRSKYGLNIKDKKFHNLEEINKELLKILRELDKEIYKKT